MIVIEGTDGVGKTYLAHRLVKELEDTYPMVYSHLSRLPLSWQFPDSYEDHVQRFTVRDRFHMSELVYTELRGEQQSLLPAHYRLVDAWLREVGAVTVLITCDGDRLQPSDRNEMYSFDAIYKANKLYEALRSGNAFYAYSPDLDIHLHLEKSAGFPGENDNFVREILKLWTTRQNELQQVTVREKYNDSEDAPKTRSDGGIREKLEHVVDMQTP